MEYHCFITGCDSVSGSDLALFRTPKDPDMLAKWQRAIPGTVDGNQRYGDLLGPDHRVCEKHFARNAIWRPKEKPGTTSTSGGTAVAKPWLNCDSVPSVFPGYPSSTAQRRRKNMTAIIQDVAKGSGTRTSRLANKSGTLSARQRTIDQKSPALKTIETNQIYVVAPERLSRDIENTVTASKAVAPKTYSRVDAESPISVTAEPDVDLSPTDPDAGLPDPVAIESQLSLEEMALLPSTLSGRLTFDDLWNDLELVELPDSWGFHRVTHTKTGEKGASLQRLIVFCEAGVSRGRGQLPITTKRLYFGGDLCYELTVLNMNKKLAPTDLKISPERPATVADVEMALRTFAARKICQAGPWPTVSGPLDPEEATVDETGLYRHRQCHGLAAVGGFRCPPCRNLLHEHRTKPLPQPHPPEPVAPEPSLKEQKLIARLKMKLKASRIKFQRLKTRLSLPEQLRRTLLLPTEQRVVVEEMLSVAKTTCALGKRYSMRWMQMCLLLCACSSESYKFLRQRNILPLPSIRSLVEFGACERDAAAHLVDTTSAVASGADAEDDAVVAENETGCAEDDAIVAEIETRCAEDDAVVAENETRCAEDDAVVAENETGCAEEDDVVAEDETGYAENDAIVGVDDHGNAWNAEQVEATGSTNAVLEMDLDFMEELNDCAGQVLANS